MHVGTFFHALMEGSSKQFGGGKWGVPGVIIFIQKSGVIRSAQKSGKGVAIFNDFVLKF